MADVDAGVDIDLHQQIELACGRIDFGGDLGVGEAVGHLVGLAELAFDLDEKGNHRTSGHASRRPVPNPAKTPASGKTSVCPLGRGATVLGAAGLCSCIAPSEGNGLCTRRSYGSAPR